MLAFEDEEEEKGAAGGGKKLTAEQKRLNPLAGGGPSPKTKARAAAGKALATTEDAV